MLDAEARLVAGEISHIVERSIPTRMQVQGLCRQLLRRHAVCRLKSVVSSEEVVEAYYRCLITGGLASRYAKILGKSGAAASRCPRLPRSHGLLSRSRRFERILPRAPAFARTRCRASYGWQAIRARRSNNADLRRRVGRATDGVVGVENGYANSLAPALPV
jgi:hypothetical protein